MDNKYIEPLKWYDGLPVNVQEDLRIKYRDSGMPEFNNTTSEFREITDWDRIVIIYEKENKIR